MNATAPAAKSKRNPWPMAIIAYFILFGAFTAALVTFATRQKEELVSQSYYDEEIRFQTQLEKLQRTLPLNSQMAVGYDSARQSITIHLPVEHAQRVTSGHIRLYRPSDSSLDQEIKLGVNAAGIQELDAKPFKSGLWKVRLEWTVGGEDFFLDQPIVLKAKGL